MTVKAVDDAEGVAEVKAYPEVDEMQEEDPEINSCGIRHIRRLSVVHSTNISSIL